MSDRSDTGLLAPLYLHPGGELRCDPPNALRLITDRSGGNPALMALAQAIVIVEEEGRHVAHVVSDRETASELIAGSCLIDSIGDLQSEAMSKGSRIPSIRLGGEYPEVFLDLLRFRRSHDPRAQPSLDEFFSGLCVDLVPTDPDEKWGLLGGLDLRRSCRAFLFPSRQAGYDVLAKARTFGMSDPAYRSGIAALITRSSLPPTSEERTVELAPDLAKWLIGWYLFFRQSTAEQEG